VWDIFILCALSYSPAPSFPQFPAQSSLCSLLCHSRGLLVGNPVFVVIPAVFRRESRNYNKFSYKSFHSGFFSSISLKLPLPLPLLYLLFSQYGGFRCLMRLYHTRKCTPCFLVKLPDQRSGLPSKDNELFRVCV